MAGASLFLPAQGLLSMSAPPGDLSLFASGWRLSLPGGVPGQLSFHLNDGGTISATVDAAASVELWGNTAGVWLSGASALTLQPPLAPVTEAGGIPLPIR